MNTFTHPISLAYNGTDATVEIVIMLLGAAILGYFAHWLVCRTHACCVKKDEVQTESKETAAPTQAALPIVAPVVAPAVVAPVVEAPVARTPDDLEIIEGIGPKTNEVLLAAGITTFGQVASMTPAALAGILAKAGDRFALLDPGTWPHQAELARDGKMTELEEYKTFLVNGKEPTA